jgi:hypothetical protein
MAIRSMLTATLVIVATLFGTNSIARGQGVPASRPAYVQAGPCDAPGDVVARLEPLTSPAAEDLGQTGVRPIEQSVTVVPLRLSALLASDLAVTINGLQEQSGTIAACGEIGDTLNPDGTLSVDLNAINGSNFSGVAYFSPAASSHDTQISLLLVHGTPDDDPDTASVNADGANGADAVGADGANANGMDGADAVGADGADAIGANGEDGGNAVGANGRDGGSVRGADGADGVSVRGADGADGVSIDGAAGTSVDGADGVSVDGADGVSVDGQAGQSERGRDGKDGRNG